MWFWRVVTDDYSTTSSAQKSLLKSKEKAEAIKI